MKQEYRYYQQTMRNKEPKVLAPLTSEINSKSPNL